MPPIEANSCDRSFSVAAVTGASSGIGLAIAQRFLELGYACILHGNRKISNLREFAQTIPQPPILCLQQDFRDHAALSAFVDQAFDWRGRVDVWVHAAGADVLTMNREAPFEEKLQELLDVDVTATMIVCRTVADRMSRQPTSVSKPCIMTLGWDQSFAGMEGDSGQMFSAVKSAVASFSISLAKSMAPNVRVNCMAPGWIQTAWGSQASQTWQQRAIGESCMNRWGTPRDVANLAGFLASPEAEFVNGQVVSVNGGWKPNYASGAPGKHQ